MILKVDWREPGPVCGQFVMSDALMCGIRGPFGCLSADHEFLSRTGWVRMDRWSGQEILAVDIAKRRASFETPDAYIKEPCTEFWHLKSRGVDQLVSDEHLIPHVKKFNPDVWRFIYAADLAEANQRLISGWDGMIPCAFPAPDNAAGAPLSELELRIMVMICADGHFGERGNPLRCAIGLRKERKKARLRELLTAAGIEWSCGDRVNRPTEQVFSFVAPERNKSLARYWQANADQLRVIADEVVRWDGMADGGYGDWRYFTTRHEDAAFIEYVFSTQGRRTSVGMPESREEHWSQMFNVSASARPFAGLRYDGNKRDICRVVSPDGYKYCFTTSTGFFVTRRNDCIAVTGNSGKSTGCVMKLLRNFKQQKPGPDGIVRRRTAIVRNTYGELATTTIKTWNVWVPRTVGRFIEKAPPTHIIAAEGVEWEVMFLALDRPADVSKLLSMDLSDAWINEARELPKAIIDGLTGRVGRFPQTIRSAQGKILFGCAAPQIVMDTNPPDTDHWWAKMADFRDPEMHATNQELAEKLRGLGVLRQKQELQRFFSQPSGRSPGAENIQNLPPGYYERLMADKSADWLKVYVDGEYGYVQEGKAVYTEYVDSTHCQPFELMRGQPIYVGIDFGLTPAATFGQRTPMGAWRIYLEIVSQDMGALRFGELLAQVMRDRFRDFTFAGITGDPAGDARAQTDEKTPFEILRAAGIDAKPAPTNDFSKRRETFAYFLNKMMDGKPGMLIHPQCQVLRKALSGGYHYRRLQTAVGTEIYAEQPVKDMSSHVAESAQYLLLGAGEARSVLRANPEFRANRPQYAEMIVDPFEGR